MVKNINSITQAALALKDSELVIFPTETVYGLGANAYDDIAVEKIFLTKKRKLTNPLIVHLHSIDQVNNICHFNQDAMTLMQQFWPGPLAIILQQKDNNKISKFTCAGLDTIAVRMPNNEIALNLLKSCSFPIAAPSANTSEFLSPTCAEHVYQDIGEHIITLDDGFTCIGLESTIIDLSDVNKYQLLRLGSITKQQIENCLNKKILINDSINKTNPNSPGQSKIHYSPITPVRLDSINYDKNTEAFLAFGNKYYEYTLNLSVTANLQEAASNFFNMLHILDKGKYQCINIASIPNHDIGMAINDKLSRFRSVIV